MTRSGYGLDGHGIGGFVFDKAERHVVFSGGLGLIKGYFRERYIWKGMSGDFWIGGAATALSAFLLAWTGGRSTLAPHLERLGDAGLGAYMNTMATGYGTKLAKRTVKVLQGGRELPGIPSFSGVIGESVGEIPPAQRGASLSDDEFARFSQPRT